MACFDRLTEQPAAVAAAAEAEAPADPEPALSRMNLFWELDDQTHSGRGRIRPFSPLLAVPLRWSSEPNAKPISPTGEAIDEFPLQSVEALNSRC